MLGIDQSEQAQRAATPASIKTSKLADLNEDDNLKLSQLQNLLLLLLAFSSLLYNTASTPAAKQHQIIVFIGGLAG